MSINRLSRKQSTSKSAVYGLDKSGKRTANNKIALAVITCHPDLTGNELFAKLPAIHKAQVADFHELRKRISDLLQTKRIVISGKRRCSIRGTKMFTWRVVEKAK